MATMPSRSHTAPAAIASILPQVDRLWLFLDRFDTVPAYAQHERIRILRSQDTGDLRGNGKFTVLFSDHEPFIFFGVDDDIEYPVDYCGALVRELGRRRGVVVGVHAAVLRSPLTSDARDRKVLHRRSDQGGKPIDY
jgi:hypothetical protein